MEERLAIKIKENNIKDSLKEVKARLVNIIDVIDYIQAKKGNMYEGMGLIHKVNRVTGDLAYTMKKASDIGEQTAELSFELGRDYENREAK